MMEEKFEEARTSSRESLERVALVEAVAEEMHSAHTHYQSTHSGIVKEMAKLSAQLQERSPSQVLWGDLASQVQDLQMESKERGLAMNELSQMSETSNGDTGRML